MNDWIEHPWEREDREIREALEKKDTEIERLSTAVAFLSFQNGLYHKPLLARAADALESYHRFRKEHLVDCNTCELVRELRKALNDD